MEYKWIKNPTPVIINNMIEESGSTKNAMFTLKSPVEIHSNKVNVNGFSLFPRSSKNMPNEITNEPKTAALAIKLAKFLEKYFLPKLIKRNPSSGKSGTNQINSFIAIKI